MRDHKALVQKDFGLFDRGMEELCPANRNTKVINMQYTHFGAKTREGTVKDLTFPNLVRFWIFRRIGQADRLLLLNTAGEIHDSTNIGTPILTIVGMTDFSVVLMFDRVYISPHDGKTGLPGEVVYVYTGTGVARPAGGSPPSGFNLTGHETGDDGKIDKGTHLFAVAFETDTGYITRPGPIDGDEPDFKKFEATGGKKFRVTNIPVGPAGTVARHILATRLIFDYKGDQKSPELFFVPKGKIENNTDVALTIDFYDSDLVASADYLFDNLDEIPAFLGMCDYGGRLCGWGENEKPAIIRASQSGQPESHSGVEGFVIVSPGDGLGLTRCVVHRGNLHCYKKQRHFLTQDNGSSPVTWNVALVDAAVGTDVNGVSIIMDSAGQTMDQFVIASRQGLMHFAGAYSEQALTFGIDDIWKRINQSKTHLIQVSVDPIKKRIYITLPVDGSSTINMLLMGDYEYGLSAEMIRWSVWSFTNYVIKSIIVDTKFTDQSAVFTIGASSNTYQLSATALNDDGTAIPDPEIEFAPKSGDDEGLINHYTGIRLRVVGSGVLGIIAYGLDRTISYTVKDIVLSANPGKEYTALFEIKSEKCIVSLKTSSINEWFHINKYALYFIPLWVNRG